jgi:hypothetical protein
MGRKLKDSAGVRLKRDVSAAYALDPRETALLERACGIADELELIEAVLAAEPLTPGGVAHPLLKAQAELAGRFQRLLEGIDLPHKSERPAASSRISQQASRAAKVRWARAKGGANGVVA